MNERGGLITAGIYYRTADRAPPPGIRVLVVWDGRAPFEAARLKRPDTGRWGWCVRTERGLVYLPARSAAPPDPLRPWIGWHTLKSPDPEFWRPLKPELWAGPLPEPVEIVEAPWGGAGRMWCARQSFDAVTAAEEAAIAAAEGRQWPPPPEPRQGEIWWPGPYAAAGAIERAEAEVRIIRALRTLDAVERGGHHDTLTRSTSWPGALIVAARVVEERLRASRTGLLPGLNESDLEQFHIDRSELRPMPARFVPERRDLSDLDGGVLRWLEALDKTDRRVVTMRAALPPHSFRAIGTAIGTNRQRAQQRYERAIGLIWGRANNLVAPGDSPPGSRPPCAVRRGRGKERV